MNYLGPPMDWGLPERFASWWPGQESAAERIFESLIEGDTGLSAPTGSGKTPLYMAQHALLASSRTVVVTSTKALEQQLFSDFSPMGLRVIHGRANYSCRDGGDCDQGRMRSCRWQRQAGDCPYIRDRSRFLAGSLGCTNYSYALAASAYSPDGIGKCDLLVLDESHNALAEIGSQLTVELPLRGVVSHKHQDEIPDLAYWRSWAEIEMPRLQAESEDRRLPPSARITAERWARKLATLSEMGEDWVVDKNEKGWEFNPVWPAEHARRLLYRCAKRVLFVSATLRPKTLELLGAGDANFIEVASTFDPNRAPIHLVDCEYVNFRMNPTQRDYWLGRIDQMIRPRLDRKGLIHTVSYDRARLIKERSPFGHLMKLPDTAGTAAAIEEFRRSKEPGILISPAIMTGYDFPMRVAEWQILSKAPFTDKRGRPELSARRRKMDPEYEVSEVAQKITQMCGRIVRSPEDQGETLIADNTVARLIETKRHLFSGCVLARVRHTKSLPEPLPKL